MKNYLLLIFIVFFCINACNLRDKIKPKFVLSQTPITLNLQQANRLAKLPLKCLKQEYPNKLGQVLNKNSELREPSKLHPIFYGCFDWHSSVHGHWLLVVLSKKFPKLQQRNKIIELLNEQFTTKKIAQEMAFFKTKLNDSFERTYGWAWFLKLQQELKSWNDPQAQRWAQNLEPMAEMIVEKYLKFLPKLRYPIRSGEHINTAFGLSLAFDYAEAVNQEDLKEIILSSAKLFYGKDRNYPLSYEPSGYDFLSPAFQEIDLMRKILPKMQFKLWLKQFLPQLMNPNFSLAVGQVSDRSDGKLVHLDGLNFSRAWCLYDLAHSDPSYQHLNKIADQHLKYSLPEIIDGDYMGEHWLASFAVYALLKKDQY